MFLCLTSVPINVIVLTFLFYSGSSFSSWRWGPVSSCLDFLCCVAATRTAIPEKSVWYQCICHCVYYISNLQKTSVIPVQLCFVFIYQFKSILQFSTHDHRLSENFLILFSPYTIYSIVSRVLGGYMILLKHPTNKNINCSEYILIILQLIHNNIH